MGQSNVNNKNLSDQILNFDTVKSRIHQRLLSVKYRDLTGIAKEFLCESIYKTWYIDLTGLVVDAFAASVAVTDDILRIWGHSLDEIKSIAKENDNGTFMLYTMDSAALGGAPVETFEEISDEEVAEMMEDPFVDDCEFTDEEIDSFLDEFSDLEATGSLPCDGAKMVAVTNIRKIFGAVAALDYNIQKRLSQIFPCGYYLIPSSVHEMLAVSADPTISYSEIRDMIREINTACEVVRPEERLADEPLVVIDGQLIPACA